MKKNAFIFTMAAVLGIAIMLFGMLFISTAKTNAVISEINALRTEIEAIPEEAGKQAAADTAAFMTLLFQALLSEGTEEAEPEIIPLGPAEAETAAEPAAVATVETAQEPLKMDAEMTIMESLIELPVHAEAADAEADEEGWEDVAVPGTTEEAAETAAEGEINE